MRAKEESMSLGAMSVITSPLRSFAAACAAVVLAAASPVAFGQEDLPGRVGRVANLAGVYRVLLPRVVAALRSWQDTMSPVTDGSAARAAGLVLADHLDEWVAGEALLQRLLVDPAGVARAGAHQQRLETILVTARSGA